MKSKTNTKTKINCSTVLKMGVDKNSLGTKTSMKLKLSAKYNTGEWVSRDVWLRPCPATRAWHPTYPRHIKEKNCCKIS